MYMSDTDDVGTVADTDTRERTVRRVEGVVIGRKTHSTDCSANRKILNRLCFCNVAVDKDTRCVARCVLNHDRLNQPIFKRKALDCAFQLDQRTEHGFVIDLCGSHRLRRDLIVFAQKLDGGDLQLHFALIEVRGTGNLNLVADFVVAGDREAADTRGLVFDVDAIKERSICIIAGSIGGHDALDGVLYTGFSLCLNIRDRSDHDRMDVVDEVLTNLVVGVVLLRGVVQGRLNLEIAHESRAGNDDQTIVPDLLGSKNHQAVVAFLVGVLRNRLTADAVAVGILGTGACVSIDDRRYGCGNGRGRIALCINNMDAGAAVLAEHFRVQTVIRVLRVNLNTLHQEAVHIVGIEVQTLCLTAVQGIVIGGVVGDAQGGTERRQNLVLLGCHMIFCGESLVAFVVVRPAGEDEAAARRIKCNQRCDFRIGVGSVWVAQGVAVAAGRSGQDDRLVLAFRVCAGGKELFTGLQFHGADGVACRQIAEVAHRILVVTGDILIEVRSIDADINQL